MNEKSYEQTKQEASAAIGDMYGELGRLRRTYNNYRRHGAVNAANNLLPEIEAKQIEIEGETHYFNMAFN